MATDTFGTHDRRALRTRPSTGVRIIAILAYTGFAIPVSIVAMSMFGLPGLLLAVILAWQWTRVAGIGEHYSMSEIVGEVAPESPTSEPKSSGNASFDAYRSDLMTRLEEEQKSFEGFLSRLRAARDKAEFDEFLDARARKQIEGPSPYAATQPQPS